MKKQTGKHIFKRFAGYYRPHMGLFILDMACALGIAIIDLIYPMLSRTALNEYLPQDLTQTLRPFLLAVFFLLILYIIKLGLKYVVEFYGHVLGIRIEYDLRKELFSHLQKLTFKFYDKNRTGRIMSRMINDLNEITEMAHHGPEDLFLSLIMLVGAFFAMLFIEWHLAIAVYIFIPILVVFSLKQRTKMSDGFRQVKEEIGGVNANLESSISGIRVSKAFTNEAYEVEKFDQGNLQFRRAKDGAYKTMAVFFSGMVFMTNLLNVVVLGYGGFLIYKHVMDYADLIAFMLYVNSFLAPIQRLTQFVQQYESGMAGFIRFTEIMDEEPEIKDAKNAIEMEKVEGNITFDHVNFSYNDEENILQDISLRVGSGQTVALVGPSGGGKTTICHLIPRFYEATSGKIMVDGKDIRDIKIASLRSHIGLVSQDVFLFAGTIRENILYGRIDASEEEMIEAAKAAQIHDYIESLAEGYDTIVGERGLRLSGGQKQRISIARVFLKNPEILLLDEATSALDNTTEIRIQQALDQLSKGRTTLVIAHRLSTVKNADRIVVITNQGILEEGQHEELLEKEGIYADLYKAQFKALE